MPCGLCLERYGRNKSEIRSSVCVVVNDLTYYAVWGGSEMGHHCFQGVIYNLRLEDTDAHRIPDSYGSKVGFSQGLRTAPEYATRVPDHLLSVIHLDNKHCNATYIRYPVHVKSL
jgi:hypothetical protein